MKDALITLLKNKKMKKHPKQQRTSIHTLEWQEFHQAMFIVAVPFWVKKKKRKN